MKAKLTKESSALKEAIRVELGVDISSRKRNRDNVDGRMIFARILRDRGYSLKSIGKSMDKDHSTVIHYLYSIDKLLTVDDNINAKHLCCLSLFQKMTSDPSTDDMLEMSDVQLKNELIALRTQYNSLFLKNQKLTSDLDKLKKEQESYGVIFDIIKSRMNGKDKDLVVRKLHQMFNGL